MEHAVAGGYTIIGNGSDWFWAMAQFIVVAVTLVGIYYQFRLDRGASAFDQIHRLVTDLDTELILRAKLTLLLAARDNVSPLPEGSLSLVHNQWESLGMLVRGGHLHARLFHDFIGNHARAWWAILGPTLVREREETGDPRVGESFEWLARRMAELDRQAGIGRDFESAPVLEAIIDQMIQGSRDKLQLMAASGTDPAGSSLPPQPVTPTPPR